MQYAVYPRMPPLTSGQCLWPCSIILLASCDASSLVLEAGSWIKLSPWCESHQWRRGGRPKRDILSPRMESCR
ncbi:hypothetical protein BDZ85DRAFT_258641 [Elsinoe ampelina]|uniref:Uncharacterized protein n=1 Tax=Elsinoe ampelina TaxID=302913 RepID=A0A6A6GKF2_9PEZI|nr:hypothetical protein BDZ85DRAFT_258641 [Elsinoe ampelina]